MQCERCGLENYDEAYYCRSCGAKMSKSKQKRKNNNYTAQQNNFPYGSATQQSDNYAHQNSYQQQPDTQQNDASQRNQYQQQYNSAEHAYNDTHKGYSQQQIYSGQQYNPTDTYQNNSQQQHNVYNKYTDNQHNTQQIPTTNNNDKVYSQYNSYTDADAGKTVHTDRYESAPHREVNSAYPDMNNSNIFETFQVSAQRESQRQAQYKADIPVGRLVAIVVLTSVLIMSLTFAFSVRYGKEHSSENYISDNSTTLAGIENTNLTKPDYEIYEISAS